MLAGDEALPAIEGLLQATQAGNPVVAIGGTLKTSSKILKLALDHKAVLAFASYAPEGRDAEQLAATVGREQGLRLTADVARRIAELTGGDRTLMANEIEKRSEEHTSELQSLMRISYAVFCLKKRNTTKR